MTREGDGYRGVLPKPQKATKAIDYYLEVLDTQLRPARTAEFSPQVVARGEVSLSGQTIPLAANGSFDMTGTLMTPNLIRYAGTASATSLQATISCASRPGPTGSLSASGSDYTMTGTFAFGNAPPTPNSSSQGTLTVRRATSGASANRRD